MAPRRDKYGLSSRYFNIGIWFFLASVVPSVFVLSLPWLATNPDSPFYLKRASDPTTALSGYLNTLPATGLMGGAFVFTFVVMWSDEAARVNVLHASPRLRRAYYSSLTVFTLSYALFVATPTDVSPLGHAVATVVFALAVLAHFVVILTRDKPRRPERWVLVAGMPFLLLTVISVVYQDILAGGRRMPPYVYWGAEALSLVTVSLFTPVHVFFSTPTKQALGLSARRLEELRAAFAAFDSNADGSISARELRAALSGAGMDASDEAVRAEELGDWDLDGDGRVSFPEFVEIQSAFLVERGPLVLHPVFARGAAAAREDGALGAAAPKAGKGKEQVGGGARGGTVSVRPSWLGRSKDNASLR